MQQVEMTRSPERSSLPLLALPIGVGAEGSGCTPDTALVLTSGFFKTVLDCSKDNDPLGLLALVNKRAAEKSPISIEFYQMDFEPGCDQNEIELTLYENVRFRTGKWPVVRVTVNAYSDRMQFTLHKTSSFSKSLFLEGVTFPVMYASLVAKGAAKEQQA